MTPESLANKLYELGDPAWVAAAVDVLQTTLAQTTFFYGPNAAAKSFVDELIKKKARYDDVQPLLSHAPRCNEYAPLPRAFAWDAAHNVQPSMARMCAPQSTCWSCSSRSKMHGPNRHSSCMRSP